MMKKMILFNNDDFEMSHGKMNEGNLEYDLINVINYSTNIPFKFTIHHEFHDYIKVEINNYNEYLQNIIK